MPPSRSLLILTRRIENASFRQRVAPYLAPLAERGVACEVVELAKGTWKRSGQLRRAKEFDGVWLHRKTLTALDAWRLRGARRVLYDFDDAIMYQARRSDAGPHPGRVRRFHRTMRRCDLVLAGNDLLAEWARKGGAADVRVVPTGLDASRYTPKTDCTGGGGLRLVWIGSRSTLKQVARLRPALEAVAAAHGGTSLRIIADATLEIPGMDVEFVPWTRDGEAAALAACDAGIAPLPDTPFTRGKCGFKVLQYMAAGLPVVTSPVGVNREYVRQGQTGFWAGEADEWVAAVGQLADPAARQRMGQAGRERIEREFDFTVLASRVCDAVGEVLG